MFFIGIFGINEAQKVVGSFNNVICRTCGAYSRYEIFKTYSYFHIFFIPTFKWNTRYYVRSFCCNSIFELDPSIGMQFDRGLKPEIGDAHLRPLSQHSHNYRCSSCGVGLDSSYSFCPYCGRKIYP